MENLTNHHSLPKCQQPYATTNNLVRNKEVHAALLNYSIFYNNKQLILNCKKHTFFFNKTQIEFENILATFTGNN